MLAINIRPTYVGPSLYHRSYLSITFRPLHENDPEEGCQIAMFCVLIQSLLPVFVSQISESA